jgi:hypothetical protein
MVVENQIIILELPKFFGSDGVRNLCFYDLLEVREGFRTLTVYLKLSLGISIAICVTDTWLHIAIKTVPITNVDPIPLATDIAKANLMESISLGQSCYDDNGNNTFLGQGVDGTPCVILSAGAYFGTSTRGSTGLQILENAHDFLAVYNFTSDRDYAYLGGSTLDQKFSIYNRNKFDFVSNTFALDTVCQPITSSCNFFGNYNGLAISINKHELAFNVSDVSFACNPQTAFSGNLGPRRIVLSFFTNSSAIDANVNNTSNNPFYFGIAVLLPQSSFHPDDPTIVQIGSGAAAVFSCQATAHNANYTFVNGSVRAFNAQPSNVSVANMFMTPMAFTDVGYYKLYGAAQLAAASSSNSSEVARVLSSSFSKIAAALMGPGVQLTESPVAQMRTDMLVARVPMAPLFTLVGLNLAFVVCSVGLGAWALKAASTGAPWHIRTKLGISAVVAQMLGEEEKENEAVDVDDFFNERRHVEGCGAVRRVGLEHVEGRGWEIKALESTKTTVEDS